MAENFTCSLVIYPCISELEKKILLKSFFYIYFYYYLWLCPICKLRGYFHIWFFFKDWSYLTPLILPFSRRKIVYSWRILRKNKLARKLWIVRFSRLLDLNRLWVLTQNHIPTHTYICSLVNWKICLNLFVPNHFSAVLIKRALIFFSPLAILMFVKICNQDDNGVSLMTHIIILAKYFIFAIKFLDVFLCVCWFVSKFV